MEIHWRETFLLTQDLSAAEWTIHGEPSWRVTREALDGGNGDLFSGTTTIELPDEATGGGKDYLVTASVWNTQRDGSLFVAVRYADPNNYYAVEYASSNSRLTLRLVKVLGGVRTVLQSVDSSQKDVRIPDLTYGAGRASGSEIAVAALGDRLCASLGAEAFLQATDGDLPTGGVALGQTNYHPFFDDITVYFRLGAEAPQESERGKVFQVAVPNRDEGNAVVMDLMEMGLGPAELVDRGNSLFVSIGPFTSRQDVFDVRDYLGLGGYAYEEVDAAAEGSPTQVPKNEPPEPEREPGGVENATGTSR